MTSATDRPAFTVRRADWARDAEAISGVRRRVFVEEQSVPAELEWDGADETAVHLLALNAQGQAVGTARLLASGQIGRMAVVPAWRRRGVGSALLRAILAIAREDGRPPPFLNAQTSALSFYRRAGFAPEGTEFEEAGIAHWRMVIEDNAAMTDDPSLSDAVLGETAGPIRLSDREDIRSAVERMAVQARRELCIFTQDLDASLYDRPEFLDQVRRLAVAGLPLPVRVLLMDAEPAVRRGHRLIELARHLTSFVQIRRVPEDFADRTEAYMLADGRGYVLRPMADAREGIADFYAPLQTRRMRTEHERIWELGDVHPGLRRLHI